MSALRTVPIAAILLLASPATAQQQVDPLRFFEGRTESHGTVKVLFHKAYRTSSVGYGRIEHDGSLTLVQRVEDEGKPPHDRRWRVHRTGPGRFAGTMSEASGPVTIEKAGDRYRFRFTMKGNLSVEQWLAPLPGNGSASSVTKIRRFGLTVATSEAVIRKVAERPGA
jgi:hypothetical protein